MADFDWKNLLIVLAQSGAELDTHMIFGKTIADFLKKDVKYK